MRGLSVSQIAILFAWWSLTALLFEIPSGALADYWSRKNLLVIAPIVKAICFIIWLFAGSNFYLYALGFVFWSIGSTLVSGTSEALLYDNLVLYDKKDDYEKIWGKKRFFTYITLGVASIAGGFIAAKSIDLALISSLLPLALSSFFALFLNDAPKVKSTEEIHYIDHIKKAFKEVKFNNVLLLLIIYSTAISIIGNIEEFNQLYYELAGLPIFAYGIVEFACRILGAFGSLYAYKLIKTDFALLFLPLASALLLLFIGLSPSIPMVLILVVVYLIDSPLQTITKTKIQHSIKSSSRATTTSLNAFMVNLFSVGIMLVFSFVSKTWNLNSIYYFTSIFFVLLAVFVLLRKNVFLKNTRL